MSSRPNGSPPPYESENAFPPPTVQPAYSYYPDDEFQHFYRWTSPPGIIKIMSVIVIVLCLGIFACVASTLAWDSQNAMSGFGGGGYGGGGSYGGSSYGGSYGGGGYGAGGGYGGGYGAAGGYGYGGIGGGYNDPRQGKGFMIAMAGISFIVGMVVFIIIVSHQNLCQSRRFYLAVVIMCAILALLMLIATIVYLVAVNPMAQSSSSMYAMQIQGLCAQYQQPATSGVFVNQYLYHYCVVEPQEAIAVVCGFLVVAALIIMLVFALKTRQKIRGYGKSNILWKKIKVVDELAPPGDVEAWVNNVSALPEEEPMAEYPIKPFGSREYLDNSSTYDKPLNDGSVPRSDQEFPARNSATPYSSISEPASSTAKPKKRRPRRARQPDGQTYETDYNSSGDELDDDDYDSEFPRITNEDTRIAYKQEFDRDHKEYKDLQAELDSVNRKLSDVDKELDDLQPGSPQFLDALDEYNKMKDSKKSADYQMKKRRCKYLKGKLNHIKKMVSDFDHA